MSIISAEDSVLVVIDLQDHFLEKLIPSESQRLLDRILWLVRVANWLHVPLIVTAEDLRKHAPAKKLELALTSDTAILDKMVFNLADQPDILAAVKKIQRKTAVLLGLETDVCIAQSAIGLLSHDFRVVVLSDATGAPGDAHEAGLARMRDAGVILTTVRGLYYEWMRTVEQVERFEAGFPPPKALKL